MYFSNRALCARRGQVNLLFFLTPFLLSVYIAVSVRVGTMLGEGDPDGAKRSVRLSVQLALVVALAVGGVFYLLRDYIALLYTNQQKVIDETSAYVPIVALDFVISSFSYVLQGVLEGSGKPERATAAAIVGNWIVGIGALFALSHYLGNDAPTVAEQRRIKLQGLWWGVVIGEGVKMLLLLALVLKADWSKWAEEAQERAELEEAEEDESVERFTRLLGETQPLLVNDRPNANH